MFDERCPLFFCAKIVRCAKVLRILHVFREPKAFGFWQSQGKDARHERQHSENYHGHSWVHLAQVICNEWRCNSAYTSTHTPDSDGCIAMRSGEHLSRIQVDDGKGRRDEALANSDQCSGQPR